MKTAYEYQQKAIDWADDKDKIPLFMEMRLGKTLVAIRIAKKKNPKRVLIVCPKTVIPTWIRELEEEGIEPFFINAKLNKMLNGTIKKVSGWFVTNYEALTRSEISLMQWDVVILDEGTKIRNIDTKIAKICTNDFEDVPVKMDLTGTPAPESLIDYFNQFKFLYGDCLGFKSWYEFNRRFFPYGEPLPYFKKLMTDYVSENAYLLKREHVNIGSKKVYSERYCVLDPEAKKEYRNFENLWLNESFEAKWAIVAYNYMQQMAGGLPEKKEYVSYHKINEVYDMLKMEVPNDQIVIWFRYLNEINETVKHLRKNGISCGIISGEIASDLREQIRLDFQAGNYKVLCCQIQCAGMGVDLSAADTVFYYSNSFSALDRMQSEDRVIHPSKERILSFTDFITSDTIDVDIYESLKQKLSNATQFLQNVHSRMIERRLGHYWENLND